MGKLKYTHLILKFDIELMFKNNLNVQHLKCQVTTALPVERAFKCWRAAVCGGSVAMTTIRSRDHHNKFS